MVPTPTRGRLMKGTVLVRESDRQSQREPMRLNSSPTHQSISGGSKAEKLRASKCFLLFPQHRTSRLRYVSPVPSLVAFDHRSGFSLLKKLELSGVNEPHRSAGKNA